ncbi:MAG: PTS sugar transporter subunit IIA [Thermoguttaceae bacterium]
MPSEDYDIYELAKYLHMTDVQVRKLADRGQIPGRKVKGEWLFAAIDVHHWLERQIGATGDDEELAAMESVLSPPRDLEESVSISSLLVPESIVIPFLVKTKESAIRGIVKAASQTGLLWDEEKMADAIRKREELHTTALDNGVALLHPRRPMPSILAEPFLVLGIAPSGIPFGGGFSNLTDIFFLICSTDERGHLRLLARLSRIISSPRFLDALRDCTDESSVRTLVENTESQISG